MDRNQLDFSIQEAGCLLYLADKNFGGYPIGEFHEFFSERPGLKELTMSGAVIAASLYQDDGYNVRVVSGELTDEERDNWTSRISWKLDLTSGQMAVSGVCDPDLGNYIKKWPIAEDGGDYELGTFVVVPPGTYAVSIYSYPPNDLAGGWMRLENARLFREAFSADPGIKHEKLIDYFNRTRPGETPRDFIVNGWEDAAFLDFLVHLMPLTSAVPAPDFEEDACVAWEYRKPEKCPVGIELASAD